MANSGSEKFARLSRLMIPESGHLSVFQDLDVVRYVVSRSRVLKRTQEYPSLRKMPHNIYLSLTLHDILLPVHFDLSRLFISSQHYTDIENDFWACGRVRNRQFLLVPIGCLPTIS